LHGLNGFFGLPPRMTATQIALSFFGGIAFYVGRMSTGSLVICMVLHAAWDFGSLGIQATERTPRPIQLVLMACAYVGSVVAVWPIVFA